MGVIIVTAALVAAAGALLGPFLLLRKLAMLTDALSHAILPGIVAAYFLARGPNLLAAFLGATVAGLLTAAGVAALQRSGRLHSDAAIGTVFPALFALGVFLVSRFFAHVHLDTDAVLAGNLEFAAAELLIVGDTVLGPQALWVMGGLLAADALFVFLCFKELKLITFDPPARRLPGVCTGPGPCRLARDGLADGRGRVDGGGGRARGGTLHRAGCHGVAAERAAGNGARPRGRARRERDRGRVPPGLLARHFARGARSRASRALALASLSSSHRARGC